MRLVLVATLLMSACTASRPSVTSTPTSSITATASPSAAPSPTQAPTTRPTPQPTAEPKGVVTVLHEFLVPWQSSSNYAYADVVVVVKNTGTGWVELQGYESDYTIYDGAGNVAETGGFSYTYPKYLGPGETGYYAENLITSDTKAKNMEKIETNTYYVPVDQEDVIVLTTAKITNKKPSYSGDGPTTTGTVTNTSTDKVASAAVAAFYFDGSGDLLGFSYTNLISNLGPGQTKGFSTLSAAPYMTLSTIKKTVAVGSPSY